jgi:hypothetical protein
MIRAKRFSLELFLMGLQCDLWLMILAGAVSMDKFSFCSLIGVSNC